MKKCLSVILAVLVFAAMAQAERPPQSRDKAKLVVSGTVKKIATKTSSFGGDGIRTDYTAEVAVDSVEKGGKVKAGDTISVTWFRVTKAPTGPINGAFGHSYAIKEKDKAKFWLVQGGSGSPDRSWVIIYNGNGVEKIGK